MNELIKEINGYLRNSGRGEELLERGIPTVALSFGIMEYAHREQKRVNGDAYKSHPIRCLGMYREMIGIDPFDYFGTDAEALRECGIPFEGMQEVCLLHDVIEDSELSFEDVRGLFAWLGYENYFDLYIAEPLKLITHDKTECYDVYIKRCMENPVSALAKMVDMQDNSYVFTLDDFGEKNYERTSGYIKYIFLINEKYHFIENATRYRNSFSARISTKDFHK